MSEWLRKERKMNRNWLQSFSFFFFACWSVAHHFFSSSSFEYINQVEKHTIARKEKKMKSDFRAEKMEQEN